MKTKDLLEVLASFDEINVIKAEEDTVEEFIDNNLSTASEEFKVKRGKKKYEKGKYYFFAEEYDAYDIPNKPTIVAKGECDELINLYVIDL